MHRRYEHLLHFDGLVPWMKDNQYIKTHYRPMSQSYTKSLASVFGIHNETVNIWTHLVPGIFLGICLTAMAIAWYEHLTLDDVSPASLSRHFALSRYQSLSDGYASADSMDAIMLTIYAAGAATMFTASWFYHSGISSRWIKLIGSIES